MDQDTLDSETEMPVNFAKVARTSPIFIWPDRHLGSMNCMAAMAAGASAELDLTRVAVCTAKSEMAYSLAPRCRSKATSASCSSMECSIVADPLRNMSVPVATRTSRMPLKRASCRRSLASRLRS